MRTLLIIPAYNEADGISVTVECSQADKGRFAEFLV